MNPWVIIRWCLVVMIYAATLFVAHDQVRIRDRKIAEFEEREKQTNKGVVKISTALKTTENNVNKLADSLQEERALVATMTTNMAKFNKLKELDGPLNQMQVRAKILSVKCQNNRAAMERHVERGQELVKQGTATEDVSDRYQKDLDALKKERQALLAEAEECKQALRAIDARRKGLEEKSAQR